jgi:hypothetical protein
LFIFFRSRFFLSKAREDRQEELLESFAFFCACCSCENDVSPEKLESFDPSFVLPDVSPPSTFKEALGKFGENCEYIKRNFNSHPSLELLTLMINNIELLALMGDITLWPH